LPSTTHVTSPSAEKPAAILPRLRSFVIRHRISIRDLFLLFAALAVATFIAFEFDIYENEGSVSRHEETVDLDEALSLGGLLCIGLLIFAARRHHEQAACVGETGLSLRRA
jgi:hypothetical protein